MRKGAVRLSIALFLLNAIAGFSNPHAVAALAASPPALPAIAAKAFEKYRAAMAALPKPPNMVFTYSETRTGPTRIVSGTHRVYRDKVGNQRNDTIAINELPVRPPLTQTFARATWPYFADQFFVSPGDSQVAFGGTGSVNGKRAFVYNVKRLAPTPFAITQLALDPASGLPLRELYTVSTPDCNGSGGIDFILVGSYVVPSSVWAQCTMSGAGQFKDTIRFSDYSFPAVIPLDVLHPSGAPTG